MNFLEEECLDVTSKFVPLQSSFTTSGSDISNEGGRPAAEDGEVSTDGEASRDKRDRANE